MSNRIAHRPRFRTSQAFSHFSRHTPQPYLRTRWTYRNQFMHFEARRPGQSLRLLDLHRTWRELAWPVLLQ